MVRVWLSSRLPSFLGDTAVEAGMVELRRFSVCVSEEDAEPDCDVVVFVSFGSVLRLAGLVSGAAGGFWWAETYTGFAGTS